MYIITVRRITSVGVGMSPSVETGPTNPKVPACLADITDLFRVLKNAEFAMDFAQIVGHRKHPHYPRWESNEDVSQVRTYLHG